MIEKHSLYEFELIKITEGWVYVIYDPEFSPSCKTIMRESEEWFDTESEARLAAIGHISLLENGER